MAIHWQVKFRSLRSNALYTANIYDDDYTGDPVQLTGAANPFETQEDDNDGIFAPIRMQSGYLRIVDTGTDNDGNAFNWRDMIPSSDTDRPVTLTHTGNGSTVIDWVGFIQPTNFGVNIYDSPQEVEFPLQCPLTIMEGIDVNYRQTSIKNFAYLLKTVIDCIPEICRPRTFVIQGSTHAQTWLMKCICWQLFAQPTDNFGNEASMSMYDALTGMLQYWGWTMRIMGHALFLTFADDTTEPDFLTLDYESLSNMANGTVSGDTGGHYIGHEIIDGFADAKNTDSQIRGPYRAIVSADPDGWDTDLVDPLDNDFENEATESQWEYGIQYNGTTLGKSSEILSITRSDYTATATSGSAAFRQIRKLESIEQGYGSPIDVIEIQKSFSGSVYVKFEMNYERSYSDGFFIIHGKTYRGADEYVECQGDNYEGNREMYARLSVRNANGTMWWDGKMWRNYVVTFILTIGNSKPQYFSRYWESELSKTTTSIIPTGTLYGTLCLELFGSGGTRAFPETDGQRSFNLTDFRIEFTKNNNVIKTGPFPNSGWYEFRNRRLPSKYDYKWYNDNRTRQEYTDDNVFCSENLMKPGFAVVLNANGSYSGQVNYGPGAVTQYPEQHKAERIANYWASSKRKLDFNVISTATMQGVPYAAITPAWKLTFDGTTLYPLSISRKWRDDVLTMVLVEI